MFEQAFKNIEDILRKEAGCTTELDYTEHIDPALEALNKSLLHQAFTGEL